MLQLKSAGGLLTGDQYDGQVRGNSSANTTVRFPNDDASPHWDAANADAAIAHL